MRKMKLQVNKILIKFVLSYHENYKKREKKIADINIKSIVIFSNM